MSFHLHLPHLRRENSSASVGGGGGSASGPTTPKGCIVIKVGAEGEERQRFVVPVAYLNHPLFAGLLREAEEEYGFHHEGAIVIPCRADYFRQVRGMIDRETGIGGGHHHHHHHHQFHSSLHLIHLPACFRAVK